jgi:hypothetical protein
MNQSQKLKEITFDETKASLLTTMQSLLAAKGLGDFDEKELHTFVN